MLDSIGVVLRLVFETLAAALRPAAEAAAAALRPLAEFAVAPLAADAGALALAAAVVTTLALLAVAIALFTSPVHVVATAPHPRRAIADDTRLAETHPDAPGHSRPRAPGSAALAA